MTNEDYFLVLFQIVCLLMFSCGVVVLTQHSEWFGVNEKAGCLFWRLFWARVQSDRLARGGRAIAQYGGPKHQKFKLPDLRQSNDFDQRHAEIGFASCTSCLQMRR